MRSLKTIIKAVFQLSPSEILGYGIYQFNLRSGRYQRLTPSGEIVDEETVEILKNIAAQPAKEILSVPSIEQMQKVLGKHTQTLLVQASAIANKQVQLYGASGTLLDVTTLTPLVHWSRAQKFVEGDIKDIWELARFGWVFILGRAYILSGNERFSQSFWENFETFSQENPLNQGVNWASGQEVALRIMAFSFAWQVFHYSKHSTEERRQKLVKSIYEHAERIPPTLIYAKAQNNNHLISEAVGLYTAGYMLEGLPKAIEWRRIGRELITRSLGEQIDSDGTYVQQSMNYHRVMLHLALWANAVTKKQEEPLPDWVLKKLAAATRWLLAQVDPLTGCTPNLGSNDGALILPLTTCAFENYRPTAQSASVVFLGVPSHARGAWDEMNLWLDQPLAHLQGPRVYIKSPGVLRLGGTESWGTLRAARFYERPSHADQLHVDLWWQGNNVAIDAGTYRYNFSPPWQNGLARTKVHNTVLIDDKDQMLHASRFLWLDWAQAKKISKERVGYDQVVAEHDGYRKANLVHRRSLSNLSPSQWLVEDKIFPTRRDRKPHSVQLHWLTHDWPYEVFEDMVRLKVPWGTIEIVFHAVNHKGRPIRPPAELSIIRAGRSIYGPKDSDETLGWFSPTYSVKKPALSILFNMKAVLPIRILSNWNFIYNRAQ